MLMLRNGHVNTKMHGMKQDIKSCNEFWLIVSCDVSSMETLGKCNFFPCEMILSE